MGQSPTAKDASAFARPVTLEALNLELQVANKQLRVELSELRQEQAATNGRLTTLVAENEQLVSENARLKANLKDLDADLRGQNETLGRLDGQNKKLQEENFELAEINRELLGLAEKAQQERTGQLTLDEDLSDGPQHIDDADEVMELQTANAALQAQLAEALEKSAEDRKALEEIRNMMQKTSQFNKEHHLISPEKTEAQAAAASPTRPATVGYAPGADQELGLTYDDESGGQGRGKGFWDGAEHVPSSRASDQPVLAEGAPIAADEALSSGSQHGKYPGSHYGSSRSRSTSSSDSQRSERASSDGSAKSEKRKANSVIGEGAPTGDKEAPKGFPKGTDLPE